MAILTPERTKGKILIIEDNESVAHVIQDTLEEDGYEVTFLGDARATSAVVDPAKFDVVVSDFKMTGQNGLQFFTQYVLALPKHERPAFVLISGLWKDGRELISALPQRVPFLHKPFTEQDILTVVGSEVLERRYRKSRNRF